ncbi:MAG: response regulator transcription factor [Actinobacteria bacterium]|nr:response regulator transcription factor [Actinomycetota bacterium]
MVVGGTFVTAGLGREAVEPLDAARRLAEEEPDHFVATVTPVFEAIDALEVGDVDLARDRAERSLALGREHQNEHSPLAPLAHSVLAAAVDDPASARLGAELAGTSPRNLFLGYAHVCAADVLCAVGDPEGPAHLRAARRIVDAAADPGVVGAHLDRTASRHRLAPVDPGRGELVEPLTEREVAVLRHLPTSLSQREIAAELYVSVNTVKSHTRGLYRKLGASSRDDAVRRARELGLL